MPLGLVETEQGGFIKKKKKKEQTSFWSFALNNFHCCMKANINNSAEEKNKNRNSAPRSKITTYMEETISDKT